MVYAPLRPFLISDVQLVGDESPVLAFMRLDRGAVPVDHHSLALLGGPTPRLLHVSTETLDIEAVGQGQQYLRRARLDPSLGTRAAHSR